MLLCLGFDNGPRRWPSELPKFCLGRKTGYATDGMLKGEFRSLLIIYGLNGDCIRIVSLRAVEVSHAAQLRECYYQRQADAVKAEWGPAIQAARLWNAASADIFTCGRGYSSYRVMRA
jgi:hypothetical protein